MLRVKGALVAGGGHIFQSQMGRHDEFFLLWPPLQGSQMLRHQVGRNCGGDKMKTFVFVLEPNSHAHVVTHTRNMLNEKNAGSYSHVCPLFYSLPIKSLETTCTRSLEVGHPSQAHARILDKKNSDHVFTQLLEKGLNSSMVPSICVFW